MQLRLSHTFLTCSVYSEKSDCGREHAAFVMMLLCSQKKKPSQDQQSSVKTSCSVTPDIASQTVLAASLTQKRSLTTFIM